MLIGSADAISGPKEKVVFAEDLPPEELEGALSNHPPGLVNLGNTCYMNSVLQTLTAIPELETTIKNATYGNSDDISLSTLSALREVISQLKSSKASITPLGFLLTLHKNFPQFAERRDGFLMQQDAEECWTQLVHCFKKLPSTNDGKSLYEQLFEGEMEVTYRNLESEEEPVVTSDQKFDKLSCHINNNVNFLFQGLALSLQEKIEKNSSLLNRTCEYEKTSKISKLPFYIPVQFVRFFWRSDTNTKAKIVRPVEFPLELDVYDYCTEELKKQLLPNRTKILENKGSDKIEIEQKPYTNETGLYQLQAVISHKSRDAEAGHYVAWVHVSGDDWLLFDDDKVSEIKSEDIQKLSGKGGGDWHIAYLCLYKSKEF